MLSRDREQDAVTARALPFEEYLEALLKAPPFDTAPRRAGLLRYLVEKSLAGEADSLNEYAIALEVFGKPESFDQRIDSSVRSEISRLRRMVAVYYDGPGAEDSWRIVFPARGYVPQIEQAEEEPDEVEGHMFLEESAPRLPWSLIAMVLGVIAAVVVGILVWERWEAHKLRGGESAVARAAEHTPTPEAQALNLKGQYYSAHRTEANLREAVDAYTQAIVSDSNDAAAYAGLAECYDLMPEYSAVRQGESFARAIAAANKALALDPTNAVAHRALGFALYWSQTDVSRAFTEFQEAIHLAPNDAEGHHWYATALNSS
jgi:tetratricopeptide (TPR) repeat protein